MAIRWKNSPSVAGSAAGADARNRTRQPEMQPVHCCWLCLKTARRDPAVLEKIGVPTERLEHELHAIEENCLAWQERPRSQRKPGAHPRLRPAFKEAANFKDEYVSTEICCSRGQSKKRSGRDALTSLGATHEAILKALTAVRGTHG